MLTSMGFRSIEGWYVPDPVALIVFPFGNITLSCCLVFRDAVAKNLESDSLNTEVSAPESDNGRCGLSKIIRNEFLVFATFGSRPAASLHNLLLTI